MTKQKALLISIMLGLTILSGLQAAEEKITLENEKLKIRFNDKGLSQIYDKITDKIIDIEDDNFSITVNDNIYDGRNLEGKTSKEGPRVLYIYNTNQFMVEVIYELQPGRRFVSKQITLHSQDFPEYTVKQIKVFEGRIGNNISETYRLAGGRYGISLRMKNNEEDNNAAFGCFMLIQNPFGQYEIKEKDISILYDPDMKWKSEYGEFASDRFCIGAYQLTGTTFRADMVPEWQYIQNPDQYLKQGSQIDWAEIEAVTNCARAFLLEDRQKSARVHIGWCENDYQIDVNTPEGVTEYKRILDQAADFGCQYVLYTPHHSGLAPLRENRDAWGWESLLWLNLGQKIRKDEWIPGKDEIPPSIQDFLDYAKSKNLKLMAYVYPTVPFMQNPEWTDWLTSQDKLVGGYSGPDTGIRSFQDWLVDKLADFVKATGCGGFSFDHWWTAYTDENEKVSSRYQQWYGCRRVLENLRKRIPEVIIDGRQQYHHFGTWTWLAGTYPHPMMSDEQPGSFNAIVDLSTDRVNGARQRFIAWRLMTRDFCPIEILPGFITHQTQRSDANRVMRRDRFHPRDWDYLGWKYNLISSIATAPFNHVVNFIPARDIEEYRYFPEKDKKFFRDWLDFTDKNAKYMKKIRPIIGQPMTGRCDGTSAIIEDNGFVFLFNPNYRKMNANFKLDSSIGLTKGGKFIIKELFPQEDFLIGCPEKGLFSYGDNVSIAMEGTSARVLKIEPVKENLKEAVLFNSPGQVNITSNTLTIINVTGKIGEEKELNILLPEETAIKNVTVNGQKTGFNQMGRIIECKVKFAGQYFSQAQQIRKYDAEFNEQAVEGKFTVPKRIFDQLAERKEAWPIKYTEDDLIAPWLDPSRLLLFVQIAEPYMEREVAEKRQGREVRVKRNVPIRKDEVTIEIDGAQMEVKEGYNGIYPYVERTCMGIYTDVSGLKSDVEHSIKVTLPAGLKPGQFQGLFFEHVENEFTTEIVSR